MLEDDRTCPSGVSLWRSVPTVSIAGGGRPWREPIVATKSIATPNVFYYCGGRQARGDKVYPSLSAPPSILADMVSRPT